MIANFARALFGSSNERRLRPMRARVEKINALEGEFEALSDEELKGKTAEFRRRLAEGAKLDDLLEEAFAATREAAKRAIGLRHFDVQLVGGMVLHQGSIAEMKTGEGKTLVATAPVYLNALEGKGVHVVTVNDYLARRDADWMGRVYAALGLTTGCIVHGLSDQERKAAYACDVTYGTNNEFGFDYLRDNMKYSLEAMAQRGHRFAIVDEVDSILIDESRTPLIISGPTEDRSDFYKTIDEFIPKLDEGDFELDEKARSVTLTEDGNEHIETLLKDAGLLEGDSLYDPENVSVVHHVNQALRAHKLFQKDKDYIIRRGMVVIIDEFTGRMMEGRRYSEGLHQALEAKEKVEIQPENVTLASITFQNYFRLYDKLAGMTGTAATEAAEFENIYKLGVFEIPTNQPIARRDEDDEVYRTAEEKYRAILIELADARRRGQPVLVGTASIEKSELLSAMLSDKKVLVATADHIDRLLEEIKGKDTDPERIRLKQAAHYLRETAKNAKRGEPAIPHKVLNARHHEQEAMIVAQAGAPGAITVATNMAGRGTDIKLGGNEDFILDAWVEERTKAGEAPAAAAIDAKRREIAEDIQELKRQVIDAGGLFVLGTERHESRRIDNQLRGRSGRQGDPGLSKFYVSLEDDLMRIFGHERLDGVLRRLGIKDGEAIVHPWVTKAMETAQKKVEQRNFESRKNVLKYDDVVNDQRKAIFEQRREFMHAQNVQEIVADMRRQTVEDIVASHAPAKSYPEEWDLDGLGGALQDLFGQELAARKIAREEGVDAEILADRLVKAADAYMAEKAARFGPEVLRQIEKAILLQVVDRHWRDHILRLDHLRTVVGLRGYGQRDPLNEFKTEAFTLFENLLGDLRKEVTAVLARVEVEQAPREPAPLERRLQETHRDPRTGENEMERAERPSGHVPMPGTPRNAPCPCGSGKKFKHCHGAHDAQRVTA